MQSLSWNEIRSRAITFSRDWKGVGDERAEAQTFWNEFFTVFGKKRRLVASFEERVKSLRDTHHRIDLFWPGTLLAEHKSAGQPLDKAQSQAFAYITELASSGRESEIPRYVIVSDFARMVLYDLEGEEGEAGFEFPLQDLHKYIKHFAFFLGQKTHTFGEEDPANLEAAAIMARLHDTIEAGNYTGPELERLLVRLLFCLFADDTGIFETNHFDFFLQNRTREDGSDLGAQLNHLFEVLNTPPERRSPHLDEDLAEFPYINGDLFANPLHTASFNPDMRNSLIAACRFDWSRISPAIFGSLFQGIMDGRERRQIGAHYTSERDILKLIRPLFLDELHAEFEQIRKDNRPGHRNKRLEAFRDKLAGLRFLDPACGCGNFLVIAYRELRRLEHRALDALYDFSNRAQEMNLGEGGHWAKTDVNQFYGIEIGEWPARIAETALWLTDHQMNVELSLSTGVMFQRIPLKATPHIRCANALRMDWNDLLPAEECSFVLGNPPFVGHHYQTEEQKEDQQTVLANIGARGVLDYVCNWYVKAAEYVKGSPTPCAFVSTNSITQGEQVGILWSELFNRYQLKILFAHRTFAWQSEARGRAHVHVVIIGFGVHERGPKRLFDYQDIGGEAQEVVVSNISPYLIEGADLAVTNRTAPLCSVPRMLWGNKPTDGGHLILSPEERDELLRKEPGAAKFVRRYMSGGDFINERERYCLWLKDAAPQELAKLPLVTERIKRVRAFRLASKAASTRRYADFPTLFRQIAQPDSPYLAIPEVSSERRLYIPMAYLSNDVICSNKIQFVPDATVFHFGILTSLMHMAWMRQVCGRLESRYSYSNSLVYNNFPWPDNATTAQRTRVENSAQKVLDVRQGYLDAGASMADIYDPLRMPAPLLKAHQALDRSVDRCYRAAPFTSERERVEYLFQLYEAMTAPLALAEAKKKRRPREK